MSSSVYGGLGFARISGKDLLCMIMWRIEYREFDHSGTLTRSTCYS